MAAPSSLFSSPPVSPTSSTDFSRAVLLQASTRLGANFDPIADNILLSAIYISLALAPRAIPWWMVAVVFGRDVLILAMAGYGLLFTSLRKFPPSVWGNISTFFQIAAALVVMGARRDPRAR